MFELTLRDGKDLLLHRQTTFDFLEVIDQIAEHFDGEVAGAFVVYLLEAFHEKLSTLRIGEWNLRYTFADNSEFEKLYDEKVPSTDFKSCSILLHKLS